MKPIYSTAFLPQRRGVEEWSGEVGAGLVFVLASWEAWSVGRGGGLEDGWLRGGRAMVGMEGKGEVVDVVDILCSYGAYPRLGGNRGDQDAHGLHCVRWEAVKACQELYRRCS